MTRRWREAGSPESWKGEADSVSCWTDRDQWSGENDIYICGKWKQLWASMSADLWCFPTYIVIWSLRVSCKYSRPCHRFEIYQCHQPKLWLLPSVFPVSAYCIKLQLCRKPNLRCTRLIPQANIFRLFNMTNRTTKIDREQPRFTQYYTIFNVIEQEKKNHRSSLIHWPPDHPRRTFPTSSSHVYFDTKTRRPPKLPHQNY